MLKSIWGYLTSRKAIDLFISAEKVALPTGLIVYVLFKLSGHEEWANDALVIAPIPTIIYLIILLLLALIITIQTIIGDLVLAVLVKWILNAIFRPRE